MTTTTRQLFATIMALPEPERFALADALQEACEPPCPELKGEAWLAEIRRRSAAIDAGTAVLVSWEEVQEHDEAQIGVSPGG